MALMASAIGGLGLRSDEASGVVDGPRFGAGWLSENV